MTYNMDFLIAAMVILLLVLWHFLGQKRAEDLNNDMLPSYRTMKYKSPIWWYFHVQKKQNRSNSKGKNS